LRDIEFCGERDHEKPKAKKVGHGEKKRGDNEKKDPAREIA
jgi:hypothetical protein